MTGIRRKGILVRTVQLIKRPSHKGMYHNYKLEKLVLFNQSLPYFCTISVLFFEKNYYSN